jgi:hypothetical protein
LEWEFELEWESELEWEFQFELSWRSVGIAVPLSLRRTKPLYTYVRNLTKFLTFVQVLFDEPGSHAPLGAVVAHMWL